MTYEWNQDKRLKNFLKHGVEFSDAAIVLEDDFAITIQDLFKDEERFITIGRDAHGRILVVVYAHKQDVFRIISARKANKQEREIYEKKL